jgi:GMP synthase (glutamine-hydrolysing)
MFHGVLTLAGFNANYADAGVDSTGNIEAVTPDVLIVLGGPIGTYESERYSLRSKNCTSRWGFAIRRL